MVLLVFYISALAIGYPHLQDIQFRSQITIRVFKAANKYVVLSPDHFFPFLFGDGVIKQKKQKKAVWGQD